MSDHFVSKCHNPNYYETMSSRVRMLRYTAKCSPSQRRCLDEILAVSCEMYTAMLESWKGSYAWWGEHNPGRPSYQRRTLTDHIPY